MAQSTLESVKEKTGKFSVSVERVVNLGNYESLRVGFAEVLELGAEKPEEAYARILEKVNGWTSQLKPVKGPGPATEISAMKPVISSEDKYAKLSWKQSLKRTNLETLMASEQLLQDPVARELHEYLKEWKTLRVDKVQYKWSEFQGNVYLQRWSPLNAIT